MITKAGLLVYPLSTEAEADRRLSQFKPRPGINVRLWQMKGLWHVWSAGPDAGTWWLLPVDGDATEVMRELVNNPSAGEPVIKSLDGNRAISVAAKEICRARA